MWIGGGGGVPFVDVRCWWKKKKKKKKKLLIEGVYILRTAR